MPPDSERLADGRNAMGRPPLVGGSSIHRRIDSAERPRKSKGYPGAGFAAPGARRPSGRTRRDSPEAARTHNIITSI